MTKSGRKTIAEAVAKFPFTQFTFKYENWNEFVEAFSAFAEDVRTKGYDKLRFDFDYDYDYYDDKASVDGIVVYGERLETDDEYNKRKETARRAAATRRENAAIKQNAKYQQLKALCEELNLPVPIPEN